MLSAARASARGGIISYYSNSVFYLKKKGEMNKMLPSAARASVRFRNNVYYYFFKIEHIHTFLGDKKKASFKK